MERLSLALPYNPTEYAIHSLRYFLLRGAVAGKRVLDIACGEGLGTSLISSWGAARVVGVDVSGAAISAAKARYVNRENAQLEFICADAFSYLEEVAEDFDIIISAETIEHVKDPHRFLELCRSRLSTDGCLVVTCPNDHYYYGGGQTMNRYHLASYHFHDFKELAEGVLGSGTWALGAPLNGFGLFPLATADLVAGDYGEAQVRRRGLRGETIPLPVGAKNGLTPGNSLFYLGVWGPLSLRSALGIAIPYESDHRLGELRSVSRDIAQGAVRRMALVHDSEITTEEIESLCSLLKGKYGIETFAWSGDVDALAVELLSEREFDNIHFEAPEAFDALAEWVCRSALAPEFLEVTGARWSAATLTVRPNAQLPSSYNLDFADGAFGPAATIPRARTAAGDRAVLWSAEPYVAERSNAAGSDPFYRLAVVMPIDAERDWVEAWIAGAQARAGLAELAVYLTSVDRPSHTTTSSLAEVDALLCLASSGAARRTAEQAIRRGLPVILPSTHPLAPLLGNGEKSLVMAQPDVAALSQALQVIYLDRDARSRIRGENLALAEQMATNARGVFWTRALAQAQLTCSRYGAPLRTVALKAAARAAKSVAAMSIE